MKLFRRTYTRKSTPPDVEVLALVDRKEGQTPFLARVTMGGLTGWLWAESPATLGLTKAHRKTPLTWDFATYPDGGRPVRLRRLTRAEKATWDARKNQKP